MNTSDLETLFDYSYWANEKLFRAVRLLSAEQFTQRVAGSYGSVRDTLVHALSVEWGWVERCGGPRRGAKLVAANYPVSERLIADWTLLEPGVRTFLRGLREDDLERLVSYPAASGSTRSMPVGQLLQHAANHSVHYRAQAALLVRELGYAPGDIDLLFYFAEKRGVDAW